MSRCKAEGPASRESHSPRGSTSSLHVVDRCHVARERRAYFNQLHQKQHMCWTERVDDDQSYPCHLWWSFDELLGRGRPQPADIDVTAIHRYLDDKVIGVLLLVQIHHLSRSAQQAAHSRIFFLSRRPMLRNWCVRCPISSVPPIHS